MLCLPEAWDPLPVGGRITDLAGKGERG